MSAFLIARLVELTCENQCIEEVIDHLHTRASAKGEECPNTVFVISQLRQAQVKNAAAFEETLRKLNIH